MRHPRLFVAGLVVAVLSAPLLMLAGTRVAAAVLSDAAPRLLDRVGLERRPGQPSPRLAAQSVPPARPAPVESPDPQAPRATPPRAGAGAGAAAAGAAAGGAAGSNAQDPQITWERNGEVVRFGAREVRVGWRTTLRAWQDYVLREGDAVRDVVVVSGTTTIDGVVTRDVVSVLGSVTLGPTAVINGSLVIVAGNARIAPGARVRRDLVVIGGDVDAPVGFYPGGEHMLLGSSLMGDRLRAFVPWLTGGLLLGRPVVPSIPWVWSVMGIFLIVSLAINVLMHRHVGASADRLAARPFSTFLTGLLVLLLIGPAAALLTVTVVGVVVLPFMLCALLLAWMTGKVGVARALGRAVFGTGADETRLQGLRAVVVGFVAIMLVYTVPFLGLIAWALVGVFGLGAAVQAFAGGLRRERAKPAAVPPPPPGDGPGNGGRRPVDDGFGPASPSPAGAPLTAPALFVETRPQTEGAALDPFAAGTAFSATSAASASADPFDGAFGAAGAASAAMPAGAAAGALGADALGLARPSEERARALLAFPRARFLHRFAALVVDVVLVFFANGILDIVRPWDNRGMLLLFLIYFVGGWAWKGTTIGGIICNLRVAKTNGKPLEFPDALGRGIAGVVSLLALGLGLLWVLIEPERQGWHDKLTDTCVVQVPRSWPI